MFWNDWPEVERVSLVRRSRMRSSETITLSIFSYERDVGHRKSPPPAPNIPAEEFPSDLPNCGTLVRLTACRNRPDESTFPNSAHRRIYHTSSNITDIRTSSYITPIIRCRKTYRNPSRRKAYSAVSYRIYALQSENAFLSRWLAELNYRTTCRSGNVVVYPCLMSVISGDNTSLYSIFLHSILHATMYTFEKLRQFGTCGMKIWASGMCYKNVSYRVVFYRDVWYRGMCCIKTAPICLRAIGKLHRFVYMLSICGLSRLRAIVCDIGDGCSHNVCYRV